PAITMPLAQGPGPRATQVHLRFENRVERWRTISIEATDEVLRATGVQIDDDLLLALVAVESAGRPDARSATGAMGLTQVEPTTFSDLQRRHSGLLSGRSLEEPRTNLVAGALYLADCARALRAD